jgi:FlaA1/EpsC-like NDP-sugar epimerase
VGVARFVNISTDKAANPTSVLGRSKRLGECLVAQAGAQTGLPYISVRFGNVLASRGSVLTTFSEQLAAGGPITVTHPEVTRYFMTIPEAVQLVVQASVVGRAGQALVLDMGEPVRILDMAYQLMEIAGQGVDVVFTGLRVGEKLHEQLFGEHEVDRRPAHPLISHVQVPALTFARARQDAATTGVSSALVGLVDRLGSPDDRDELASVTAIAQVGR